MTGEEQVAPAAIRVTGPATPEDVAAVVAVLAAASGGSEQADTDEASPWASHAAAMRRAVGHGRGAWRASTRPS